MKTALKLTASKFIFALNPKIKSKFALKRNYETTFIVDSIMEDGRVDAVVNKYTGLLTKNNCEVTKTEKSGRKKFAYPIKKRQTGNYVSIEFTGEGDIISKLERAYHLDDDILRFLNVHYDKKTKALRDEYFQKKIDFDAEKEQKALLAAEKVAQEKESRELGTAELTVKSEQ